MENSMLTLTQRHLRRSQSDDAEGTCNTQMGELSKHRPFGRGHWSSFASASTREREPDTYRKRRKPESAWREVHIPLIPGRMQAVLHRGKLVNEETGQLLQGFMQSFAAWNAANIRR
jgi:hypothetical protein